MKEFVVFILENSFLQTVLGTLLGVVVGHYLASRFQRKMLEQQLESQKAAQQEMEAHIERVTEAMTRSLQRELIGINAGGLRSNITCVDGPRLTRVDVAFYGVRGCLRSCVRPLNAVVMTAGPDGFREPSALTTKRA